MKKNIEIIIIGCCLLATPLIMWTSQASNEAGLAESTKASWPVPPTCPP